MVRPERTGRRCGYHQRREIRCRPVGQRDFPQTILQKRQSELQELLNKNIAFKKESQRLLAEAEKEALAPLQARLANALAKIGNERGLAFILNTDQNATPWMNPALGEDVTDIVKNLLK